MERIVRILKGVLAAGGSEIGLGKVTEDALKVITHIQHPTSLHILTTLLSLSIHRHALISSSPTLAHPYQQ
jgi:hypothetical protein